MRCFLLAVALEDLRLFLSFLLLRFLLPYDDDDDDDDADDGDGDAFLGAPVGPPSSFCVIQAGRVVPLPRPMGLDGP